MTTFVFRLKAPRATFALDMTDEEREIMGRHAAYWQPLIDSGHMVIFGPVLDSTGSWGLGVAESVGDTGGNHHRRARRRDHLTVCQAEPQSPRHDIPSLIIAVMNMQGGYFGRRAGRGVVPHDQAGPFDGRPRPLLCARDNDVVPCTGHLALTIARCRKSLRVCSVPTFLVNRQDRENSAARGSTQR